MVLEGIPKEVLVVLSLQRQVRISQSRERTFQGEGISGRETSVRTGMEAQDNRMH